MPRLVGMKVLFSFLYLIIFMITLPTAYADTKPLQAPVFIDNKPIKTKYVIKDGHLHVPALFFKNTGAYVDWNNKYKSTVFRLNETMFALPDGKKYVDDFTKRTNTWKRHPLPTETMMIEGKPYVPLVNVAKRLGMDVSYDANSKSTYITSNNSVAPNIFRHGDATNKLIALTFDDGPDEYYTSKILDILKEKGVHATFFMMGKNIKKYPHQVKRMVAEGHGLGNHSYNHPDLRKIWSSEVAEEIQSTQAEMLKVVGKKPDIIRPPYGELTKADTKLVNEMGLRNVLWSVDTLDWEGTSGDKIVETVQKQASPGGIILQHNFESKTGALDGGMEALPKIIDELRQEGYTFVTIQTLLDNQPR